MREKARMVCARAVWLAWVGIVLGFTAAAAAQAAPLDLDDPTPRRIEVRFEVSPSDEPGRLDDVWSAVRTAHLEPDPISGLVRIRVPAEEIEAHLRTTGTEAVEGSFSEFVWTLDPASGHVVAAELTGRVRERFSIGLIRTSVVVDIRVEMTTQGVGGFRSTDGFLGIRTHQFCSPAQQAGECTTVVPARFDPERGYVNAVGSLKAQAAIAEIRAFSPLGEARFSEWPTSEGTESVVSGTSYEDAVCSAAFDGPCVADLGGES